MEVRNEILATGEVEVGAEFYLEPLSSLYGDWGSGRVAQLLSGNPHRGGDIFKSN